MTNIDRATPSVELATTCSDGWHSNSTGPGTCSWHGGVDGGPGYSPPSTYRRPSYDTRPTTTQRPTSHTLVDASGTDYTVASWGIVIAAVVGLLVWDDLRQRRASKARRKAIEEGEGK